MKTKTLILTVLFLFQGFNSAFAQDDDDRPVRDAFSGPIMVENQTIVQPFKSSLQLEVYHRMGNISNGISDIFGIYGASNILLGLNYGISDDLMVGFGTIKDLKLQRFHWKYSILKQTQSGSMPIALSYYGNFVIEGGDKIKFGAEDQFKSMHRFSYFTQLIIARKFHDMVSAQVAPSFVYFNAVDQDKYQNMNASVMGGLRFKPFWSLGMMAEFEMPVYYSDLTEPKPNFAIGIEKSTATHNFQLFLTNYKYLVNQYNIVRNQNGFDAEGLLIGFNITATLR